MRIATAVLAVLTVGCTALPEGDVPFEGDAGLVDGNVGMDGGSVDAGLDADPDDSGVGPDAEPDACVATTYFRDCDGDGFGAMPPVVFCGEPNRDPVCNSGDPAEWTMNDMPDCDDRDDSVRPGGMERCDGADTNCDGIPDGLAADAVCSAAVSGHLCVEGVGCSDSCPVDTHTRCDGEGACVDLSTRRNCNGCGNSCLLSCDGARCAPDGIVARGNRTCAWQGRYIACWGGAPGGAMPASASTPRVLLPEFPSVVIDMAIGESHQCALLAGGETPQVWCWGNNEFGQLGLDHLDDRALPERVVAFPPTANRLEEIVAGDGFTCARDSMDVWCWGRNDNGVVQEGGPAIVRTPVRARLAVDGITAGAAYVCGWLNDRVICWGDVPGFATGSFPVVWNDDGGSNARQVTAGTSHFCVLVENDETFRLECFGSNASQQLGADGPAETTVVQTFTSEIYSIAAGRAHTCVVQEVTTGPTGAAVHCFGAGAAGQLGGTDSPTTALSRRAFTRDGITFGEVALGGEHSCYRSRDGLVACWGSNTQGQLGSPVTGGPAPVFPVF